MTRRQNISSNHNLFNSHIYLLRPYYKPKIYNGNIFLNIMYHMDIWWYGPLIYLNIFLFLNLSEVHVRTNDACYSIGEVSATYVGKKAHLPSETVANSSQHLSMRTNPEKWEWKSEVHQTQRSSGGSWTSVLGICVWIYSSGSLPENQRHMCGS